MSIILYKRVFNETDFILILQIVPMIKIRKESPRHVGSVPPPRGKFPRHVAFQMSAPASWHTSGGVTLAEYHGAGELH